MPKKHHVKRSPYPKRSYTAKGTMHRTPPAFRKKVLAVVKRTQEVKNFVFANTAYGISLWDPTTHLLTEDNLCTGFLSGLSYGTADGQRVGNKVSVRSWTIKGSIVNTDSANKPFYIKMIIAKQKNQASPAVIFSDLYEQGASGYSSPVNQLADIISPLNKDAYTYYAARVFKLGPSTSTSNPNNDFSVSRFFSVDLTKHVKTLHYDANGIAPSTPSNIHLFFVGCYADNSSVTFSPYTGPSVSIQYTHYLRYTDD